MNNPHFEQLLKLIGKGNIKPAISWLETLPAQDKKALSPVIVKQIKRIYEQDDKGTDTQQKSILDKLTMLGASLFANGFTSSKSITGTVKTLGATLFAIAPLSDIKKLPWYAIPEFDLLQIVLQQVRPDWIDKWVNWLLDDNPRNYELVQQMYQQGLCSNPTNENYILGLVASARYILQKQGGLYQHLRDKPEILQNKVWQMFEVEGGGEFSLATVDKYMRPEDTWAHNLKRLSDDGILPRAKLLDASLKALSNDYAQFRAGWFSRFFLSLEPSVEELNQRVEQLVFLLGSIIPPTVSFALKLLQTLEKNKLLPAHLFIENVEPVFNSTTKSTLVLALKILESLAKGDKTVAQQVSALITNGLYMENADVQKRIFDMLDKFAFTDDEVNNHNIIEQLRDKQSFIVPSQKSRLLNWIPDNEQPVIEEPDIAPSVSANIEVAETVNIEPIADFEQLIEVFAQLIESPEQPLQIERLLDGISRIGRQKTSDFQPLIKPFVKRVKTLSNRSIEDNIQLQLVYLALSYIEGVNHFEQEYQYSQTEQDWCFDYVFAVRLYFLIERLLNSSNVCLPLVSMPTHGRGFINPKGLAQKIKAWQDAKAPICGIDESLTILRLDKSILTKDELTQVINELKSLCCQFANACAYALGADVEKDIKESIKIGDSPHLWISAAAARNPHKTDQQIIERFGVLGPDAGMPAQYKPWVRESQYGKYTFYHLMVDNGVDVPKAIPLAHLTVLMYKQKQGYHSDSRFDDSRHLVSWGSTIWPNNLEPYFRSGACELDMTWSEVQWHVQTFFEPLLDATVPLKSMARLLIIVGLGASEKGQQGMAIEVVIASIEEGRLNTDKMAKQMAALITTGIIIPTRWSHALKQVAAVSTRHAKAVKALIEQLLTFNPEDSPKNTASLLELLYELCLELNQSITSQHAIEFFKTNNKGGKQKTYAKKLLALSEEFKS